MDSEENYFWKILRLKCNLYPPKHLQNIMQYLELDNHHALENINIENGNNDQENMLFDFEIMDKFVRSDSYKKLAVNGVYADFFSETYKDTPEAFTLSLGTTNIFKKILRIVKENRNDKSFWTGDTYKKTINIPDMIEELRRQISNHNFPADVVIDPASMLIVIINTERGPQTIHEGSINCPICLEKIQLGSFQSQSGDIKWKISNFTQHVTKRHSKMKHSKRSKKSGSDQRKKVRKTSHSSENNDGSDVSMESSKEEIDQQKTSNKNKDINDDSEVKIHYYSDSSNEILSSEGSNDSY